MEEMPEIFKDIKGHAQLFANPHKMVWLSDHEERRPKNDINNNCR